MAALVLLAIYRHQWRPASLRLIAGRQWLAQLVLAATSGALAPALMFTAIERTSVTNIVLIETIEIPLGLLLAWLLYRESSSLSAVVGAALALLGVGTTLYLQMGMPGEMMQQGRMSGGLGSGEVCAVVGTVIFVLGATIGRRQLQTIPLGVFSVFRNLVGSVVFCAIAMVLFGPEHFIDLFSPVLRGWMLLYGGIVVVCGQLCWFSGIKRTTPADISLASAFSPVAGVFFAFLILGCVAAGAAPRPFVLRLENVAPARLFAAAGVFDTPVGQGESGPALPGQAYRFRCGAPRGWHLSFAAMYAQSNDLFYAPRPEGIALWDGDRPAGGDVTGQVLLWDAGTEMNQPPGQGPDQAPRQSIPGAGAEERDVVRPVDDGPAYGDDNLRVQIQVLGPMDFEAQITVRPDSPTSLAPGVWFVHGRPHSLFREGMPAGNKGPEALAEDGDPGPLGAVIEKWTGVTLLLAPGAWAVHQGANPLYTPGVPAGQSGLEVLAEDSDPDPLAAWLKQQPGLRASGVLQMLSDAVAAGPLIPGGAYELPFTAEPGDRLSFAFMFVHSNDLFYGPGADGIPLFQGIAPLSGDITSRVLLWDAGTEVNQMPGIGAHQAPRQSAPGSGVREMGVLWPVNDGFAYPQTADVLKVSLR